MCGIIGYTGNRNCVGILIDGLKRLEYRGYDSAGIALIGGNGKIEIEKRQGRVNELESHVSRLKAFCGIGHTRWATHGKPSDINSHPHFSGKFAVVHNGIIENFLELKIMLVNKGVKFKSETDTEVIAHLLDMYYDGELKKALNKTLEALCGSYAVAAVCSDFPDTLAVMKKDNPLIIGKAKQECTVASDLPAVAGRADSYYILKDGERALITPGKINFFDVSGKEYARAGEKIDVCAHAAEKEGFESFMLKEIHEIPMRLYDTFSHFESLELPEELIKLFSATRMITMVACGTAYNSALIGKHLIEKYCRIRTGAEIASKYRYRQPIFEKGEIVIAVSQSGETADTLAAARLAKESGAYLLAVTNSEHSQLTALADYTLLIKAGTEIAVAATKSYNCQLAAMYFIMNSILKARGAPEKKYDPALIKKKADAVISASGALAGVAGGFKDAHSVFFLGRGQDFFVATEASLNYMARGRGLDADKPRNLAKSVTVE